MQVNDTYCTNFNFGTCVILWILDRSYYRLLVLILSTRYIILMVIVEVHELAQDTTLPI